MKRFLWLPLLVGLLAAAIHVGFAQQNDYVIVPGQRVGRFELGKAIGAYGFDPRIGHWEGTADGKAYYDGYSASVSSEGLSIWAYTCKSDNLAFALTPIRLMTEAGQNTEAMKYKTAQGIGIGTDEDEVLRTLGRPDGVGEWRERHGSIADIPVRGYVYPGLRIVVTRTDSKIYAIGPTKPGGFDACRQAVLGAPTSVQQPPASTPAFLAALASKLGVALPNDVRISPPNAQVPQDVASFSGAWAGRWDNVLNHILVVEEISADGSRIGAIYATGTAPQWGISRPSWGRFTGSISRGELRLQRFSNGAQVMYRMRTTEILDATYELSGQLTRATMQRVKE